MPVASIASVASVASVASRASVASPAGVTGGCRGGSQGAALEAHREPAVRQQPLEPRRRRAPL
eukprot:CAMPEP_0172181926 /NCGR_PEP_ID=MMETSP1050-20130122/18104_1 /TAXON_ID=233186 /ORGANISM="Cryptomonas curvata, Strain CCAP979/52" /LENGTH=62 /DNA_ID=CAMNT_0012855293 /DNA_START=51 /DNA_END=235 /DNA_ORIENTATION=+